MVQNNFMYNIYTYKLTLNLNVVQCTILELLIEILTKI